MGQMSPAPTRFVSWWMGLSRRRSDALVMLAYMVGFGALHSLARLWGGPGFFSLWYPAAGLRFALLWHFGTRWAGRLIVAEIGFHVLMGDMPLLGQEGLHAIIGVAQPALAGALALTGLRRIARRRPDFDLSPPIIFGLASVAAPTLNAALFVPLNQLTPHAPSLVPQGFNTLIALSSLAVGDMLGILVMAPLILALEPIEGERVTMAPLRFRPWSLFEGAMAVVCATLLTGLLWQAGLGVQPAPGLLAGGWIGLRHGRSGAWLAILTQMVLVLPYSAQFVPYTERLGLHLGLATMVALTWLAGSYSDAQALTQARLARRERMLLQAERLKTLRAMSVSVIHEISQPLSTLAIEASHLAANTDAMPDDIAESARLIDRKAGELSVLVRRLRRFGGREVGETAPLGVNLLVHGTRQIVEGELRSLGLDLQVAPFPPDLQVMAQDVELTQALVNLVRNAMAAQARARDAARTADALPALSLVIGTERKTLRLMITNAALPAESRRAERISMEGLNPGGMGVGLAIARTIVEAHGGQILRQDLPGRVRFSVLLPLLENAA